MTVEPVGLEADHPVPDDIDLEILRCAAAGHTVHAVARRCGVSDRTIRRRVEQAKAAVGVGTMIELVVVAVRRGWI